MCWMSTIRKKTAKCEEHTQHTVRDSTYGVYARICTNHKKPILVRTEIKCKTHPAPHNTVSLTQKYEFLWSCRVLFFVLRVDLINTAGVSSLLS